MAVDYVSHQRELLGYEPLGFKQSENVSAEKKKVILPLQLGPNISNTQVSSTRTKVGLVNVLSVAKGQIISFYFCVKFYLPGPRVLFFFA